MYYVLTMIYAAVRRIEMLAENPASSVEREEHGMYAWSMNQARVNLLAPESLGQNIPGLVLTMEMDDTLQKISTFVFEYAGLLGRLDLFHPIDDPITDKKRFMQLFRFSGDAFPSLITSNEHDVEEFTRILLFN